MTSELLDFIPQAKDLLSCHYVLTQTSTKSLGACAVQDERAREGWVVYC